MCVCVCVCVCVCNNGIRKTVCVNDENNVCMCVL